MVKIGITGGVGCGKSEVLRYIREHYPVRTLMMDDFARSMMEPGGETYPVYISLFGNDIVRKDGSLDRKRIGRIVFSDPDRLAALNHAVQPVIRRRFLKEMEAAEKAGVPVIFVEAALLVEQHYAEIMDEVWYIYADARERRRRLQLSRGYPDEKISDMMARQMSEADFRRHADVVLDNSGSFEETARRIDEEMRRLRLEKAGALESNHL